MIETRSQWVYGYEVTAENNILDIDEGLGPISVEVDVGSYTIESLANAVSTALNESGQNTYTVTIDRETRLFTIGSDAPVDILFATGPQLGISIASLLGFPIADILATTAATGTTATGTVYRPQFKLQAYVGPEQFQKAAYGTVNKSASGRVQVQRFGTESFIEAQIVMITNIRQLRAGGPIEDDPNAYAKVILFLQFATTKQPMDFYPDRDDPTFFYTVLLESTDGFSDGLGYRLREMYDRGMKGYYDTGKLVFRVVE